MSEGAWPMHSDVTDLSDPTAHCEKREKETPAASSSREKAGVALESGLSAELQLRCVASEVTSPLAIVNAFPRRVPDARGGHDSAESTRGPSSPTSDQVVRRARVASQLRM